MDLRILLCGILLPCIAGIKFPFLDPSLSWNERVDDLVKRMTVEEVIAQTMASVSPSIPRLGVKKFVWSTECLRGLANTDSTAFPQALGLAASFSYDLIHKISEAVSIEARAHWNVNRAKGQYLDHQGLSCYSPVINIMRHPLWGRNQESYGEDPYLSGLLAQAFVRGLQGTHPRYIRAGAGCKHFDVHGGPENIPTSRFSFDSKVSIRDWRMTFLPQFKMCIEAGTYSLMCSFNSINGVPACANHKLLTELAREEYGFNGFVVSDDWAIEFIKTQHKYVNDSVEAVAMAIKAGCNMELAGGPNRHWYPQQKDALERGLLSEKVIRDNIKPLMNTRMRLGEFDPENMVPYNEIKPSMVQSPEHRELAIQAASMSFVLLKNMNETLPLKGKVQKLAIIGPFANTTDQLFGDYSSNVDPHYTSTVFEGLRTIGISTSFGAGCDDTICKAYNKTQIEIAVQDANLVLVCLGTGQAVEMEGKDREDLELPGKQLQLLKDAVTAAKGVPVVLLLFNAGPLNVTWAKQSPDVPAIMACFFPAQATGQALYRTLTITNGHWAPAGRLPATWPLDPCQIPAMTNYSMAGHTYRYYNKDKSLYPFGYGLSYSSFRYSDLSLNTSSITAGESISATVKVENTGAHSSYEVMQGYMSWPNDTKGISVPNIQLVWFSRSFIAQGQSVKVEFEVKAEQMGIWLDDVRGFGFIPGEMTLYVGGQQPFVLTRASSNILHDHFSIKTHKSQTRSNDINF